MSIQDIEKAEALQAEMHKFIDWMMNRNPKLTYQDCANVYMLLKMAEVKDDVNSIGYGG